MGFFGKLFGQRTTPEEPTDMRLLKSIHQHLITSGVPAAAGVMVEGRHLMTQDRRLAITVEVVEATADKLHAHVIAWRPNQAAAARGEPLEACVLGYGPGNDAIEQAANVWTQLVAAPLLSCMTGQVVLDADHFEGEEPWGVPGGHGCVGPFMVRGDAAGIDLEAMAEIPAFLFEEYPRDGRWHLVKVTLLGKDGRWRRSLEIDGHTYTHVDEDWQGGLPCSQATVVCVRFAVFYMSEPAQHP